MLLEGEVVWMLCEVACWMNDHFKVVRAYLYVLWAANRQALPRESPVVCLGRRQYAHVNMLMHTGKFFGF
jgi:hypothetical protein